MEGRSHEAIQRDPKYQELVRRRSSLGWTLSLIMLVIYFGFILLVAFDPNSSACRSAAGVMTIGIPIGLFVIVSAFVLTGIYVSKANSTYDALTANCREGSVMKQSCSYVPSAAACWLACPRSRLRPEPSTAAPSRPSTGLPSSCSWPSSALTLGITYWAAKADSSAADFYAAGGGITGFQNGLAIAGDYMSAASFLGISGLVFTSGYDGLIYSIGFLVGWPIVTVPDRRAPAQPRQVHLRRRGVLPPRADPDPHRCRPAARWSWWRST